VLISDGAFIANHSYIISWISAKALNGGLGGFGRELGMAALQAEVCVGSGRDRPINILVLVPSLDIGGAEIDLLRNLPALDRTRFAPIVSALIDQGKLSAELSNAGVKVTSLRLDVPPGRGLYHWSLGIIERSCRYWNSVLPASLFTAFLRSGETYIRIARSVARYMDEAEVDVVHSVLPSAYLIAAMANTMTRRRPLVMSRLSQNWYQREFRLLGAIERSWLHREVNIAIANSKPVLNELRTEGILDQKLMLIHNGIDAVKFADEMLDTNQARDRLAVPHGALVFSSVANLHPYKGHADLLQALHQVKDQLPPNWLLLAAGRDVDDRLTKLRQMADELGLSQHVRLLGLRRDIPVVLSTVDVHVSASWYESFPNNILEAMCAGLPVVATAIGGVPDQVADGLTGILVPARNPKALSEALLALAHDGERRKAMGRAGRERVKREFPITRSVSRLEQVYGRLGAGSDSGARSPVADSSAHAS
jgi:glycosyltransferase involved in cell wall biosynthesis